MRSSPSRSIETAAKVRSATKKRTSVVTPTPCRGPATPAATIASIGSALATKPSTISGLLHDGRVALRLKKPWRDGTGWITMDADTFLARLCSLVPRPRANTILYRGVLAPHAKLREHVVPRPDDDVPRPKNDALRDTEGVPRGARS